MVLKKRDSLQNFVLCPPPSTPLLSTSGFSLSCCCLHRSTTKVSRSQFGIDDGSAQPRKVAMLPKQTHKRLGGNGNLFPPIPTPDPGAFTLHCRQKAGSLKVHALQPQRKQHQQLSTASTPSSPIPTPAQLGCSHPAQPQPSQPPADVKVAAVTWLNANPGKECEHWLPGNPGRALPSLNGSFVRLQPRQAPGRMLRSGRTPLFPPGHQHVLL